MLHSNNKVLKNDNFETALKLDKRQKDLSQF